jgi:hypothetical protein
MEIRTSLGPVSAEAPSEDHARKIAADMRGEDFRPHSIRISCLSTGPDSPLHPGGASLACKLSFDPEFAFFVLDALLGGRRASETADRTGEGQRAGRLERSLSPLESEMMAKADRILVHSVSEAARMAFGMVFDTEALNAAAADRPFGDPSDSWLILRTRIDTFERDSLGRIYLEMALQAGMGLYERPSLYPSPARIVLALRPVFGLVDLDAGQWRKLLPGDVLRIVEPLQDEDMEELYLRILRTRLARACGEFSSAFFRSSGLDANLDLRSSSYCDTAADCPPSLPGWTIGHRDSLMGIRSGSVRSGAAMKACLILEAGLSSAIVASADIDPELASFDPFAELCLGEFFRAWTMSFLRVFHCDAASFARMPEATAKAAPSEPEKCSIQDLPENCYRFAFDVLAGGGKRERLVWLVEAETMRRLLPRGMVAGRAVEGTYGEYAAPEPRSEPEALPAALMELSEPGGELFVLDGPVAIARGRPERAGKDKGLSLASFGPVKYTDPLHDGGFDP